MTTTYTCLRVYRVSLLAPQQPGESAVPGTSAGVPNSEPKLVVTVPRETIYLPRSSQNLTAQFFPPQQLVAKSTVIIRT